MSNLRNIIRQLAGNPASTARLMVCEVKAVDQEARTVDVEPLDEGAPLLGVNLQANQGNQVGLLQVPRVGSYVVVATLSGYEAGVVVLMEDVERVEAVVGDYSLELSDEGITLNGGRLGGLVKIQELQQNLNTLKTYCEGLSNAVKTGLTAVGVGTAANGGTGASTFQTAMSGQAIVFKDMENQYAKQ